LFAGHGASGTPRGGRGQACLRAHPPYGTKPLVPGLD
jgi:hypothetical protein